LRPSSLSPSPLHHPSRTTCPPCNWLRVCVLCAPAHTHTHTHTHVHTHMHTHTHTHTHARTHTPVLVLILVLALSLPPSLPPSLPLSSLSPSFPLSSPSPPSLVRQPQMTRAEKMLDRQQDAIVRIVRVNAACPPQPAHPAPTLVRLCVGRESVRERRRVGKKEQEKGGRERARHGEGGKEV